MIFLGSLTSLGTIHLSLGSVLICFVDLSLNWLFYFGYFLFVLE